MPDDIQEIVTEETPVTEAESTKPTESKVKNPDALIKAFEATKQEKKQLEEKLRAYKDVDLSKYQELSQIDLERYKQLESLAKEIERKQEDETAKKLIEEKKWTELLDHQATKLSKEFEQKLKLLAEEKNSLQNQLQELQASRSTLETVNRELRLKQAFEQKYLEMGGDPKTSKYVWSDLEKYLQETDDGIQVIDSKGEPRTNGKGTFLGVEDLLAEYKESDVAKRFFKATQPYGSGTQPQQSPKQSGPVTISRKSLLNQAFVKSPAGEQASKLMQTGKLGEDYILVP